MESTTAEETREVGTLWKEIYRLDGYIIVCCDRGEGRCRYTTCDVAGGFGFSTLSMGLAELEIGRTRVKGKGLVASGVGVKGSVGGEHVEVIGGVVVGGGRAVAGAGGHVTLTVPVELSRGGEARKVAPAVQVV